MVQMVLLLDIDAEIDKINPLQHKGFISENVMDKWIISKLNTLVKSVDEKLDAYDITGAALDIENFTDELSNWYVRRTPSTTSFIFNSSFIMSP